MEALKSSFISTTQFKTPKNPKSKSKSKSKPKPPSILSTSVTPDPWSLSDGNSNKNLNRPKPKSKNPKNPLTDDNARRIIKAKAQYLSVLRRNQGSLAQTPKWIKRTPEQMVQYLEDDRNGHMYGRHVVAAIQRVRSLSGKPEGSYDMREVMGSFVAKLSFREMCTVLKEQKGWRQVRDFFAWMKLQLSYRPSVIVYTIVLRMYGQVGKIKLAEQTFLEMLEAGCEPDEVACGTMLCAYARWGRHKAMLSFYSAVQERGIMLSVSVFNFILSSLQKKSLHGNVIEIWRQMVYKGVLPNHFTYTVVISSFLKEGIIEEAFKTFEEMKNLGFIPEEVTYSLLISLSSKNGDQDKALELYQDMRSQRIVPSNFTCASLLAIYYKNGDYAKAVSLFSEMESHKITVDEVIYGLLIRIYGKLGLYEDAKKTFKEIEKLGLLSNEKTYIAMAQVHLNSGNCEKALGIMELMRSRNIWFSRFAYIVLLQCHVMKGDLASAEATYQALSKTGHPDASSCNDMLNLFMRLGLTEKARDFIIQIRKDQVEFSEELLKTVMKVYCKGGLLSDAEQLIEDMSTSESFNDSKFIQTFYLAMHRESRGLDEVEDPIEPSDQACSMAFTLMLSLYSADRNANKTAKVLLLLLKTADGLSLASQLVSKFIKKGDISKAEFLYQLLIKLGCKPEDAASASLISLYGKQQKLEQAQKIFEAVVDYSTTRETLYNAMIDAYANCGKPEDAYLFYKEVTEKGHDFSAVAISILVKALTNGGKYHEAENVIRSSFHDSLELDTVAYNTFIKAMLEAGRLHFAASIYERMVSFGVTPSIQTYNTMISVYGRGRNLNKAVEMFNIAQSMGVSLDEKAYTNLICYYGKAGKIHEASLLFSKMQEEGIRPGKDFIVKQRNFFKLCRKRVAYRTL
ncbi:pentatricopeptide repeat-containing protein At5g27270 isoform X2 [Cornus florida]|uniref:pentatricopeptide repeat-containing protein At5g27270 isoform X2 n=1 Tax=Cornus florida TaxID=4283 RepID=UPI0028A0CD1C|nr:pentatricopeptide repeat-containing protein At5g27270 isoform X2 [Cornus florida]